MSMDPSELSMDQRDALTGLWQAAVFLKQVRRYVEHERRPVAVVLLDIDQFMSVNDLLGRDGGDRMLGEVGRVLKAAVVAHGRQSIAARMRGDEFALLFPDQDTDEAYSVVEDTRRTLATWFQADADAVNVPGLGISAGIAASPRDATGVTDLLRKAEDGLWRAKKHGRNRIGLPAEDRMVLKSTYYAPGQLERLAALASRRRSTEAALLREALDDVLRKYADLSPDESPWADEAARVVAGR